MTTSLFFKPTDQNSIENPNELLSNTHLVNESSEIRTEPPEKSRGQKLGPMTGTQKEKKKPLRGMGVARRERLRIEEENKKNMILAQGRGVASPNGTLLPHSGVVLQGFPRYGSGPNMSVGGYTRNRFLCGGVGPGQIPPWGFVERSTHEPSSNHYDNCFKKQRIDGDQYEVRANGDGFPKYTMVPHFLPPDQRSQGLFYDHRIARYPAPPSAFTNQGSMEELGSGNPRNGTRDVKEYEFFPGNYGNSSVGDCSPNASTIDLSLKL